MESKSSYIFRSCINSAILRPYQFSHYTFANIYLFIFDCAGSSFLCLDFLQLQLEGATP